MRHAREDSKAKEYKIREDRGWKIMIRIIYEQGEEGERKLEKDKESVGLCLISINKQTKNDRIRISNLK